MNKDSTTLALEAIANLGDGSDGDPKATSEKLALAIAIAKIALAKGGTK